MDYLLDNWEELKKRLKDKYIFVFLDYDGTLTPIVNTPQKAIISASVRLLLRKLSDNSRLKLAFISGRTLEDIKNKIRLKNVIYSGNHGLEIEGPKIKFEPLGLPKYRTILERIKNDLQEKMSSIRGAFLEDKGLSLSLHYRLVDKKQIPHVKTIFHETVILYLVRNKIKIKSGKMVLEVRPPTEWDKGKVVLWLLARQQFALGDKGVFPVYIGDDVTDEDAFKVLKRRGLTVFVGKPGNSKAEYYLKNTKEVARFLRLISGLKHN